MKRLLAFLLWLSLAANANAGGLSGGGTVAGGAGDIDAVNAGAGLSGGGASGAVTVTFSPQTFVNNMVFWNNSQATRTITFDVTGSVDPVVTFSDGVINVSTGALQVGGAAVATQAGNVATATALAANGANCAAGSAPLGVGANGAAESCTDFMEEPSGNGIVARTGANTAANRTITGTANEIGVANGDGASGNPTISLPSAVVLTSKSLRVPNATTLPATCTVGDVYFDTDAAAGTNFFGCTSTNTWTLQGAGIGGLTTGTVPKASSGSTLEDSAIVEGASTITLSKNLIVGTGNGQTFQSDALTANRTVGMPDADSRTVVPNTCGAGDFVSAIGADSVVTCATPAGGGDITAVTAGAGISGGAASGAATVTWAPNTFVSDVSMWNAANASRTWTANLSGSSDPVWTYSDASADLTTGTLKQGGTAVLKDAAGNGIVARTAAQTATARTLTGTSNEIAVSNGDGAAGNPTFSIAATIDFSGKTSTKVTKTGTAAPGTCAVGETFFDTDATAGLNLFGCTSTNTWTLLGDGGGVGSGITSLGGQTGTSQSFANDTNVTMVSNADTHTLTWSGALAKARQHAATVYNDANNTFSTGAQDFGSATSLKVPTSAGANPTASGLIAYDSTGNTLEAGVNGGNKTIAFTDSNITGNASTATALAANGGNCGAGKFPLGVDAQGAAESCTNPIKSVQAVLFDFTTAVTTGDGKFYFVVPSDLNGMNLVGVSAHVITVSSSGAVTIDLARCATVATGNTCSGTVGDMLSTNLTIDANESKSATAAAAAVIDTGVDDVATDQVIRIDVDGAGTGTQGLIVNLQFQLP